MEVEGNQWNSFQRKVGAVGKGVFHGRVGCVKLVNVLREASAGGDIGSVVCFLTLLLPTNI